MYVYNLYSTAMGITAANICSLSVDDRPMAVSGKHPKGERNVQKRTGRGGVATRAHADGRMAHTRDHEHRSRWRRVAGACADRFCEAGLVSSCERLACH